MKNVKIYGIKNCDTMKKAFNWLDMHGIAYTFHDYKKEGADKGMLVAAIDTHGWENVINRKGTTWRALPDDTKEKMTAKLAVKTATETPSVIRRPLLSYGDNIIMGFDAAAYASLFKK